MHIHDLLTFYNHLFITKKGGKNELSIYENMWDFKYTYPSFYLKMRIFFIHIWSFVQNLDN
jgi:hypothetical protein